MLLSRCMMEKGLIMWLSHQVTTQCPMFQVFLELRDFLVESFILMISGKYCPIARRHFNLFLKGVYIVFRS